VLLPIFWKQHNIWEKEAEEGVKLNPSSKPQGWIQRNFFAQEAFQINCSRETKPEKV
jgi:hypothetical protein